MNTLANSIKNLSLAVVSALMVHPFIISCTDNQSTVRLQAQAIGDQGELQIIHTPVGDETYAEIHEILKETEVFEEIAEIINENLALPNDILVYFQECGEENAFYDPETIQIEMCYELIQKYKEIFADDAESDEDYVEEVINAALFTFFHELGHALVDQLAIPITGKEEDAVDEFATVLLLQLGDEEGALAGVAQFDLDAQEEEDFEELAYWDEHSLSIQRFYSTACLIYGSDPETYAYLVEEGDLPEERAEGCEEEYEQKMNSWETLLSPHLKE